MLIYNYPSKELDEKLQIISNRCININSDDFAKVNQIIEEVKKHGDKALIEFVKKFDSPELTIESLKVSDEEINIAKKEVDEDLKKSIAIAASNIETFHKRQLEKSWFTMDRDGTFLGQIVNSVNSAGVYVPGGKGGTTPLVSSVLMGAIPAKIAGVENIIMATPSRKDGTINPNLLFAAQTAGIKNIFKVGSAWAIAAMAFGTNTIPKVDIIVGPGNIYVTIAKKIVSGIVGIDMIAGPSEILVIADKTAHPDFIAADLISQAEHDEMASSILITTSKAIAKQTLESLEKQINTLARKEIAAKSLKTYGAIILVQNIDEAFSISNKIAPEHLELQISSPYESLGKIKNAGAVFIGNFTPEPIGDYIAGPNHVLPTASTARFSSALSVKHFIKRTSVVGYSEKAFKKEANDVIRLAEIESLHGHAYSVKVRMQN
ncbi:MAG: histidinol dehydrogenase [Desulfobacterales bacterium]|nr:histidinol dehydrogenase [Desulfobacterales bacterium]